ncbi:coiled-coil domain-containing protein 113 isoform X2 [Melanotaenia boesemani]|uniref:coiled-coil domain-containing protein 113 isoform X2 n=1 Tax=Melanotaenia boesemani TaxID=1250792 RepID=UPI001C05962F|nr:coiled-coil domain-containing protein 113 isoform X2 [Melanotaenia boesemani]
MFIKNTLYTNAALLAETDMLERFIGHLDPQDLEAGGDGVWPAGGSQPDGGGVGWRQKSRSNLTDCFQLTLQQKLYVARREVTEAQREQEKLKEDYEAIQASYKASMKEAELRVAETRKAKNEFERRFLRFIKDNKQDMKEPEKMLQYVEDKFKVTQLEKFNLKNQTLRAQEKKLLQQIKQKKEMGKAEYEVFFQEYSEPINNQNLDELQMNSIKVQQMLRSHKEKLQAVALELMDLTTEITNRNQMLDKLEEEIQHAEKGRLKAETLNQHLRKQLADYEAPDIIEYVQAKDKHKRLQQSIHTWERKVGIAEMALKTHTREWSKYRATLTPASSGMSGTRSGEHQIPVKLPNIAKHNS